MLSHGIICSDFDYSPSLPILNLLRSVDLSRKTPLPQNRQSVFEVGSVPERSTDYLLESVSPPEFSPRTSDALPFRILRVDSQCQPFRSNGMRFVDMLGDVPCRSGFPFLTRGVAPRRIYITKHVQERRRPKNRAICLRPSLWWNPCGKPTSIR